MEEGGRQWPYGLRSGCWQWSCCSPPGRQSWGARHRHLSGPRRRLRHHGHADAVVTWASGDLWPRWLMDAAFGLGGITFYSYPPLAYWAAAAIMAATDLESRSSRPCHRSLADACGCHRLSLASPACFTCAGPGRGAALGVLLPTYPWWICLDPVRLLGNGEISLLPLLLLALERLAEGRKAEAHAAVALAYAALALTNLPLCTLAAHLGPLCLGLWRPLRGVAEPRRRGDRRSSGGRLPAACLLACCGKVTRQSCSTRPGATTSCFSRHWKSGLR